VDPEQLEATLLGAACDLTPEQVAAAVGVEEPVARGLWNAMGFAEVPPGERAFTALDVEALRTALALRDSGLVDHDTMLVLARSMGQQLSRTADAQVEVFRDLSTGMSVEEATLAASEAAAEVLPRLEQLVVHVWRRQFAASVARAFVAATEDGMPLLAVGFVDIVDFTRSSQTWDSSTLERLLERFESETSLRVTAVGGQVIKTLGDAVMYVADDAGAAVEVALKTIDAHCADDELPDVRAGVALGPVLVRLGDVFGQPVNIASRLTDEARPRTLLVDTRVADVLAGDGAYDLKRLRRRSVRGYKSLTPYLLRHAGAEDDKKGSA
jgi:adenylate cyclase